MECGPPSSSSQYIIPAPAIYKLNGKWHLYVQAARSGFYINQRWALYAMEFDDYMPKIFTLTGEK